MNRRLLHLLLGWVLLGTTGCSTLVPPPATPAPSEAVQTEAPTPTPVVMVQAPSTMPAPSSTPTRFPTERPTIVPSPTSTLTATATYMAATQTPVQPTETPRPPTTTPAPPTPTRTPAPLPTATPSVAAPALRAPEVLSPPDGLSATLVDLAWSWNRPLEPTQCYAVMLYLDQSGEPPSTYTCTTENRVRITTAHLAPGTYHWYVTVVDDYDAQSRQFGAEVSGPSVEQSFRLVRPPTVVGGGSLRSPTTVGCPGNLATNGGFEGSAQMRPGIDGRTAEGWMPWWDAVPAAAGQPALTQPAYRVEADRVRQGSAAQAWGTASTGHRAGVYQPVRVGRGTTLTLSAWAQAAGDAAAYDLRVGLDPSGGTDWRASTVIWSEPAEPADGWASIVLRGVANADTVTIYLRGETNTATPGGGAIFDDVCLVAGPQPTPVGG